MEKNAVKSFLVIRYWMWQWRATSDFLPQGHFIFQYHDSVPVFRVQTTNFSGRVRDPIRRSFYLQNFYMSLRLLVVSLAIENASWISLVHDSVDLLIAQLQSRLNGQFKLLCAKKNPSMSRTSPSHSTCGLLLCLRRLILCNLDFAITRICFLFVSRPWTHNCNADLQHTESVGTEQ